MAAIQGEASINLGRDGVSMPGILSQIAAMSCVLQCGASGPGIYFGAGTPESFCAAQVGSIYFNSTGTVANTTVYVKRTGAGTTTGWFPVTA